MRSPAHGAVPLRRPQLIAQAERLAAYIATLTPQQLVRCMKLSPALADKTAAMLAQWTAGPDRQSVAMDSFVGDIYSGFQAQTFSSADRQYADEHLRILSGLYGVLRPLDGICPYRLEMGYRLPDASYANLYTFWGDIVAATLPPKGLIINLAAVEYAKVITPFVDASRLVAPRFLTSNATTGQPEFIVVHAKIARGAFARWLIQQRITSRDQLRTFDAIGYRYDEALSSAAEPAFVCQEFGGKGLSMRLA